VIPDADVGPGNIVNPAGSHETPEGPAWGLDIIDFAAAGDLPLEHFSCSWYGSVGKPVDSFSTAVQMMRERLDRYPRFRDVPVEVAEFAVLQDEHRRRLFSGDITQWGASFYAAIADLVYQLNVARVHEWAQTTGGVRHPRAGVIAMLQRMSGGRRHPVDVDTTAGARSGAIAASKDSELFILVYHHRPLRNAFADQQVALQVCDDRMVAGDTWQLDQWLIDRDHGVWADRYYADCERAGISPLPDSPLLGGNVALRFGQPGLDLFRANRGTYEELAEPVQTIVARSLTVDAGKAALDFTLHGHAVTLIRLKPPSAG
jgi:xylan 1,4-beta-xylosidase